jgi:transcriptional regulator with XRE-family HTH domain
MDRRDFLEEFRQRLEQVIDESGLGRSAFAQSVGMDRSTLSQLLSPGNDRLPRVETLAAIAAQRRVSVDWLLGLSREGEGHFGADIIAEGGPSIERNAAAVSDEQLSRWHTEAIGYKIRYVPSTLPDLLKTEDVIRYELGSSLARTPQRGLEATARSLAYQRRPETDMESCSSAQSVEEFARGEGIWSDLPAPTRRAALEHMAGLAEELYPTFRWFLYDGLERFAVPVTIFGPLRAAIYLGQMYFVFNTTEHVRALTDQFDDLIRGAVVQPPDVPRRLRDLALSLPPAAGR